jgi:hypothetical protein
MRSRPLTRGAAGMEGGGKVGGRVGGGVWLGQDDFEMRGSKVADGGGGGVGKSTATLLHHLQASMLTTL